MNWVAILIVTTTMMDGRFNKSFESVPGLFTAPKTCAAAAKILVQKFAYKAPHYDGQVVHDSELVIDEVKAEAFCAIQ